jgi:hypothetical protein
MALRAWALLLVLACGTSVIGCGDDSGSEDESNTPRAGTNSPGAAGKGASGKITPSEAIAGACEMKDDLSKCMGLDDVTDCVLNDCGLQPCLDGACKAYQTCIEGAADPCSNSCKRSAACETCVEDIAQCSIDMCIEKLVCN